MGTITINFPIYCKHGGAFKCILSHRRCISVLNDTIQSKVELTEYTNTSVTAFEDFLDGDQNKIEIITEAEFLAQMEIHRQKIADTLTSTFEVKRNL